MAALIDCIRSEIKEEFNFPKVSKLFKLPGFQKRVADNMLM